MSFLFNIVLKNEEKKFKTNIKTSKKNNPTHLTKNNEAAKNMINLQTEKNSNSNSKSENIKDKNSITKTDDEVSLNNKSFNGSFSWNCNSFLSEKIADKLLSIIDLIEPIDKNKDRSLEMRQQMQKQRPPFSFNSISKVFIQFNLRVSIIFNFMDGFIRFIKWDNEYFTIGILMILTHFILHPFLISIILVFIFFTKILMKNFLSLFPSENQNISRQFKNNPISSNQNSIELKELKLVSEFSKDFILNLTDIQNIMIKYILVYDFFFNIFFDFLKYENVNMKNLILIILLSFIIAILIFHDLVISFLSNKIFFLKAIFIFLIWTILFLTNPKVEKKIVNLIDKKQLKILQDLLTEKISYLSNDIFVEDKKKSLSLKQVEIFELQVYNKSMKQWEFIGFSNNIYNYNDHNRKINKKKSFNNKNKESLIDLHYNCSNYDFDPKIKEIDTKTSMKKIAPPKNWVFFDEKWKMDLNVDNWIKKNNIQNEVMSCKHEKWVYDITNSDTNFNHFENSDPLEKHYRRRRWVRNCVRKNFRSDK